MVYVSSSSTLTTHPKTMDQISIKGADVMIMTALTHTPTQVRVGTVGVSNLYSILVLPSKILYPLPEKNGSFLAKNTIYLMEEKLIFKTK